MGGHARQQRHARCRMLSILRFWGLLTGAGALCLACSCCRLRRCCRCKSCCCCWLPGTPQKNHTLSSAPTNLHLPDFNLESTPFALSSPDANSIALQALSNIRTVHCFNGEHRTEEAYAASLQEPLRVSGWVVGAVYFSLPCAHSVALVARKSGELFGSAARAVSAFTAADAPQGQFIAHAAASGTMWCSLCMLLHLPF